ncbi:MAG TPA: hypothetical protein VHO69_12340 [Phototrophicaceae bacterium]|nr:hypothetical protein [Phototrophicaceae bacterium]
MTISRRERLLFAAIAVFGALIITRGLVVAPNFTDAYYHLNAANRLVSGQGLTDPYLWTYIGAPERLPAPSHLYWMPLTSLSAAFGMWLLNAPGNYAAAQWPFALMFAATVYAGFWLGARLGGTRRHAWTAGLLTLFSGYFTRFWGAIDTFAPYAAIGSWCLVWLSLALTAIGDANGRKKFQVYGYGALAGAFAGLAHLTRADGVLLLLVGWAAVLWPFYRDAQKRTQYIVSLRGRLVAAGVMTLAYLVIMTPWFLRNLNAIGSPLPLGGTQAIWFTEYNDLFNYPPESSPATFFADGLGNLWRTRWEALFGGGGLLAGNVGTFIAVEGLIVLTPLMLVGLWQRRREIFLRGFWLYALGVHLAMTLVFPYPGYRGGLFHSAAALVPWWAALGVVGLDGVVDWVVRRRRHWNARTAKGLFSAALVLMTAYVSLTSALGNRTLSQATPSLYVELQQTLPAGARVMINDPAQLYYYTGFGGTVLPNALPEILPDIARRYRVDYLLLEDVTEDGRALAAPPPLWSILRDPPDFLTPIPLNKQGVRLYAIHVE